MPRAAPVTSATFPQWNGYPAVMANLATGNPVIVKPHPAEPSDAYDSDLAKAGLSHDLVEVAETREPDEAILVRRALLAWLLGLLVAK